MKEEIRVNHYQEPFFEEETLSLQDIINIFIRRLGLFITTSVVLFVVIVVYQFTKSYTPIYKASFDIGVTNEKPIEGVFSSIQETPTLQIGSVTQRVISNLLSVKLASKIVDSLSLYTHIKNGNPEVKVIARIINDFDEPMGPFKLKVKKEGFELYLKSGELLKQGGFNEFVNFDFLKFKVVPLKEITKEKTYEITFYPRMRTALALRNSLSIKVLEADKIEKDLSFGRIPFSGEGASKKLVTAKTIFPGVNLIGILRIDVFWGNPDDAYQIAKVLSDLIIKEDIKEKSLQYIQSKKFIESQLEFYRKRLSELEEKIKKFKEEKKIADLKASTQALISQISQLETKKSQLEIEQSILKNLEEYLAKGKEIDTTVNFAPALLSDPVLQSFYSELLQTEAELKGRLKSYSPNHPKVYEVKAKLDGLKEQMKEEIKKRVATIRTEIQSVKNQINYLKTKLENVPEDELQLARLERDRKTTEELYTFFAQKLEETRVQEAGVTSDLKIINPPIVSYKPVNARKPLLILLLSFIISVLIGGFAVFITEYIDNTIKDPEILKMKIGLPVYASIPLTDGKENGGFIRNFISRFIKNNFEGNGIKIIEPDLSSAEFEAFRKLSLNLEFAHPEKKYRVLYITSPSPEEGKTFVSINLAFVYASKGKNVVIIDSDFRKKKGHITDVFEIKKEEGLFDVLTGNEKIEDVIFEIPSQNEKLGLKIDVIPVGNIPANPLVFLESEKMKELIDYLKEKYDYVLIDGTPVLLFADSAYIANYADGVILITKYGKTNFKEIEEAKDILKNSRSDLIGVVINGVPRRRGSYYYYYYYKYYSKYYGKKE